MMKDSGWAFLFFFFLLLGCSSSPLDDIVQDLRQSRQNRMQYYFRQAPLDTTYWNVVQSVRSPADIPFIEAILVETSEPMSRRCRAAVLLMSYRRRDTYESVLDSAKSSDVAFQGCILAVIAHYAYPFQEKAPYLAEPDRAEIKELFLQFLQREDASKHFYREFALFIECFHDSAVVDAVARILPTIDDEENRRWFEEYLQRYSGLTKENATDAGSG